MQLRIVDMQEKDKTGKETRACLIYTATTNREYTIADGGLPLIQYVETRFQETKEKLDNDKLYGLRMIEEALHAVRAYGGETIVSRRHILDVLQGKGLKR